MDCLIVVFGITGDLTCRKIIPALYKLVSSNKLTNFVLVGTARREVPIKDVLIKSREHIKDFDEKCWNKILDNSYFKNLDFNDFNSYLFSLEKKHNLSGNRLIYLAIPSSSFCEITS